MALTASRCYEYLNGLKRYWVRNDHHIRIQDGTRFKDSAGVMLDKHMFTGNAKLIRK